MSPQPDFSAFASAYESGKAQVVWRILVADLETPVSAFLKLANGQPNAFLLESVEGGAVRGRYSILGMKPDLIWKCEGDKAWINRNARSKTGAFVPCPVAEASGALDSLRALVAECAIDAPAHLPPMSAGLIGYMSYDMVRLVETLPDDNPDPIKVPDGIFMRPTIMAVFDNVNGTLTAVASIWPRQGMDAQAAWDLAMERLDHVVETLESPLPNAYVGGSRDDHQPIPVPGVSPEHYCAMVEKAQDYIAAGDIFQVVLSQRLAVPFKLPPFSLYRSLRRLNPSPFLFFLDFGEFQLVGSSPEILVRLRDDKVTIRPIAGTRRRGKTPGEDEELAADLLADPKELAEHLMLLDLGRNDVGRVASIGSVKVTKKMGVEYYSHVMHIVSNVEGQIRQGCDAMDALMAGFPAGTTSGAPKIRAMEIIDELETERRSFYAGAIGYFDGNGNMDTCIALRTTLIKDGTMYVQAGAGIVADSVPLSEHEECMNKARALVRAAEDAIDYTLSKQ
ncbi:anthranilate synthase component I [Paramagnetospirillum kuznetsovii]|uniref:Anthranilate synthase component 1 n=1 Tax=Paramagnetospirillum kuznetsovii TaxID=2053833 RepID=A0A364NZV4_9PROT|nr:anthranilate synthase component I [Paramagnetospirillum kuznetsovii]RAU22405.1 anthranilate synthase component I [Paramagnetospirillum kuznetsovii]